MDIQAGLVIDRYTVLSVLGEGGMAVVYKVRHNDLDSLHALKVLTIQSRKVRERLRSEGKTQAKLRHPNIVSVTDLIDVEGAPGLVMEFIDGPGLDQLLQGSMFGLEEADNLARGIIDGVLEAHRHSLVHRDLKPGNVLIDRTPNGLVPKITDFGLVKAVMANGPGLHQTRAGSTMGTPSYMAPEQIRDAASVDERADLFSLGVVLYEMVCGKPPFVGVDMLDIFNRISRCVFEPPRDVRPDIPRRMERAILGALVADRDSRIPDCETLKKVWIGDLEEWQHERVVGAQRRGAAPSAAELLAQIKSNNSSTKPLMSGTRRPSATLVATSSLSEELAPSTDGDQPRQGASDATYFPSGEHDVLDEAQLNLARAKRPSPPNVPDGSSIIPQSVSADQIRELQDAARAEAAEGGDGDSVAASPTLGGTVPPPTTQAPGGMSAYAEDDDPIERPKSRMPLLLGVGALMVAVVGGVMASGVLKGDPADPTGGTPTEGAPTEGTLTEGAPTEGIPTEGIPTEGTSTEGTAPDAKPAAADPEAAPPAAAAAVPSTRDPAPDKPKTSKPATPKPAATSGSKDPATTAPETTPAPKPAEPAAATTGTVSTDGGVRIWLVGANGRFPPGEVPPGAYTIKAFFDPMSSTDAGSITVKAGQSAKVTCSKAMGICSVKGG
jgi:serine/threonine protein kinase